MTAAENSRSSRALHVHQVRRQSEYLAAYRLRYDCPSLDADPRGPWLIHAHRMVMDPWDVRDAVSFLVFRGCRPVGTLRLVHRRRRALLAGSRESWHELVRRLGMGLEQALRTSAIVSRVAIERTEAEAGFALRALLQRVECEARRRRRAILVARLAATKASTRQALDRAGYERLADELHFKVLVGSRLVASEAPHGPSRSTAVQPWRPPYSPGIPGFVSCLNVGSPDTGAHPAERTDDVH